MKKFYISAWFLLTVMILVAGSAGMFGPTVLFALGLTGLGLIYGLALRAVIVNTRKPETKLPGNLR
jgi:hypothetical protein